MRATAGAINLSLIALTMALVVGACTGAPPSDSPLPDTSFRSVDGGVVYDDWPAVARRPWPQSGQNGMPAGFVDEVLIRGLDRPTALRFLPDGRLLVTEQAGQVKLFPSADVDQPTVLLDIRDEVLLAPQLGLLGLAVDPEFTAEPYFYLAYTRDALLGGTAPTYGSADGNDQCVSRTACPASARLVRYRSEGDPARVGSSAEVLIDDWCITGPNHTIGTIAFAPDGTLYVGGGDGADGDVADLGQLSAGNPCADPEGKGGSLRSQDLALGTDPVGLDGTIARLDRVSGEGVEDNPLADSADRNARRIVATGLRNPYRFAFRPDTDELWIGDVGWDSYEELNLLDGLPAEPVNFGWPCFEGPAPQPEWQQTAVEQCAALAESSSAVTSPRFSFARGADGDEPCASASAATSALAFYDGTLFPERFGGGLFFADFSQRCLYVIEAGPEARPDPHTVRLFAYPVRTSDIVVGADGAMYYAQPVRGEIHRITYR